MRPELFMCTKTLLDEIADKDMKQIDIAQTYCLAIQSSEKTDWKKVNHAIINRWSKSGLDYIKKLAWSGKCFKKGV